MPHALYDLDGVLTALVCTLLAAHLILTALLPGTRDLLAQRRPPLVRHDAARGCVPARIVLASLEHRPTIGRA